MINSRQMIAKQDIRQLAHLPAIYFAIYPFHTYSLDFSLVHARDEIHVLSIASINHFRNPVFDMETHESL